MRDKDRLTAENKVMIMQGTEITELKTTTSSLVGSLQGVMVHENEIERDLKKAKKTVAVSDSNQKTFTDNVLSLMEERSSVRVKHANLCAELNEMTALVQRMKNDHEKSLSGMSTEYQKKYEKIDGAVMLKIEADHVDGWKNIETNF